MNKKYKVKLANGRLLGPLDWDRLEALVKKGVFTGQEATALEPYLNWRDFSSFPELAELLLRKSESPSKPKISASPQQDIPQKTATMVQGDSGSKISLEIEKPELEMPTLLNIKELPKPFEDERTIIGQLVPAKENTQMIDRLELEAVIKNTATQIPSSPKNTSANSNSKPERNAKSILSPRTAVILAIGLLAIGYLSQFRDQNEPETYDDLRPKTVTFPFVGVNAPNQVGKVPDPHGSMDLVESGIPVLEKSTPVSTINSIKNHFYPAVQKNAKSLIARSLLATGYLRLAEIIPKDELYFETVRKLLYPAPAAGNQIPEYVIAQAEYLSLLQRYDQALDFLDESLKKYQTPEILFQKARIQRERSDIDGALATVLRAIKASPPDHIGPRLRLLYAELLLVKKSDEAVTQAKLIQKENPRFGPGILFNARIRLKANKPSEALKFLKIILEDPSLVDRPRLSEAFLLTASALEGIKQLGRATLFAEKARLMAPNPEESENLMFHLRSKLPDTKVSYAYVLAGKRFEMEKVLDRAENQYILAREANIHSSVPLILWGRLLEKKGEPAQAIDRFQKALQLHPQSLDATIKLAELYARRYDFELARTMLDRAASLKKNFDQVDFWRGYILRKTGKLEAGEVLYKRAISNGSRFPELFIAMGDIESEKKNRELAEFYYAMSLRYDSVNPRALLGAALARFHQEGPTRAIAFLKDKLITQPNSAPIMTNLAVIYRYSGDKDSTKNYLQNAMRSDPSYAEAFRQIGDLAREEAESYSDNYVAKENNYRFALASYEGYSKLAPHDPEGYMATAELYFFVHDFGAAAKNYYKVLDLAPNYPGVRLRLSRISLNGKDTTKALQLVQEELKRYPDSNEAHVELGKIYFFQGQGFIAAAERVREEAKRDPAKQAEYSQARQLADKKYTEAASEFTTGARADENNVSAIYFLGYVNLERGNYDSAQTLLERAKKLEPLSPDVHIQLGRVYLRKRYIQKAMSAFTDAKGLTQEPEKLQEIDEAMRGK